MGYTPPYLNVRKVAGGIAVDPGGVTTDDLTIYSNSVDAQPTIILYGDNKIQVCHKAGTSFEIVDNATIYLKTYYNVTDSFIENAIVNSNLCLVTNGTGKVKFGTFTGSGDVAVNGSISILDSGGTARKLATVA